MRIGADMPHGRRRCPFERRPVRKSPQDLIVYDCVNFRLQTLGGLYAWEFEKGKRELKVRIEGQLVFNGVGMILNAALAGLGLEYLPEDSGRRVSLRGR